MAKPPLAGCIGDGGRDGLSVVTPEREPGMKPLDGPAERWFVANWKMNGDPELLASFGTVFDAAASAHDLRFVLCPPAPLLVPARIRYPQLALGGQDCHCEASGAFTGSISALQLLQAGASATILGHSERRVGLGETDGLIRRKVSAAHQAGLQVVLCVGETIEQRALGSAEAIIRDQVRRSLPTGVDRSQVVIAYEPVWAIGTGKVPIAQDIEAAHAEVRNACGDDTVAAVLYGGSVTSDTIGSILSLRGVDGVLVGGASLRPDEVHKMIASFQMQ